MTGANGFAIVAAGGLYDLRQIRARVEKSSPYNGLRREQQSGAEISGARAPGSRRRQLSQFDTAEREPLWNGPSLNAAFAAQLIGQVLQDHAVRNELSALAAYRDRLAGARALDRTA